MGKCTSTTSGLNHKQTKTMEPAPSNVVLGAPQRPVIDPFNSGIYRRMPQKHAEDLTEFKTPVDDSYTRFQWIQNPKMLYALSDVMTNDALSISKRTFTEKLLWFNSRLDELRTGKKISLKVDRNELIDSVSSQVSNLDPYSQLSVKFIGEGAVDQGGLLKELATCTIKELLSESSGLFKLCKTTETAYKLAVSAEDDAQTQKSLTRLYMMGFMLGKALLDQISVGCPLNYTLLRQLAGQPIYLSDIHSFDQNEYQAIKAILENSAEELYLQFSVMQCDELGNCVEVPLVKNGLQIDLTDQNKQDYAVKRIEHFCISQQGCFIQALCHGLYAVIPQQLIAIFEPHELENLICGRQHFSIDDWKTHSVFEGQADDKRYETQFWEVMSSLSQAQLTHLFHFVTGSMSLPIKGFKYLQSPPGKSRPFTIKMIDFNPSDPFAKGHACFNRLDLPRYPNQEQMKSQIKFISKEFMTGFGLL